MRIREILEALSELKFVRELLRGRGRKQEPSWSIEDGLQRRDAEHAEGEEFVRYRSILRTTDLSRLVILQLELDREGIRHYRSQDNMLHGGEVQLFVETARMPDAERALRELDDSFEAN